MTKPNSIGCPDTIATCAEDGVPTHLWIRNESGDYQRKTPFLDLRQHGRLLGDQKGTKPSYLQAKIPVARVRFKAGLNPGLYLDHTGCFLVPKFLPFTKPGVAKAPPPAYRRLVKRLARALEGKDEEMVRALRLRLVELYEQLRDVTKESERNHPWRVLAKGDRTSFPFDMEGQLFRRKESYGPSSDPDDDWVFGYAIWTSHPCDPDLEEIAGFAEEHGLTVTISPEWTWVWPGRSVLLEWKRKGAEYSS